MDPASDVLSRFKVVLVEPSHPGNIGAAARAMKTMGLRELVLVNPNRFPSAEATERASSADDILKAARVVSTFPEAIAGCAWVLGASARTRSLNPDLLTPRQLTEALDERFPEGDIALVFGRERSGLTNEELEHCHAHLMVPTNPEYSSLNLAMAVQLFCYELRLWALERQGLQPGKALRRAPAPTEDMERFLEHLRSVMVATGFLDPEKPKRLMSRLRLLFNRAAPDRQEINILRGILTAVTATIEAKTGNES
jgi:TrmH family RNA methyltransferase